MAAPIDRAANASTGNSRASKPDTPASESTGMITSDSLAAQSLKSGGDFASGDATASSVPSKSTTANTTDTSGAAVLPPAPDAARRDISLDDYTAGGNGSSAAYDTSKGGPQESYGGAAPGYTSTVTGEAQALENQRPKGRNITEGGFDPDAPNASFNAAIGTSKDPGRAAVAAIQKANAKSAGDAGYEGANAAADGGGGKGGFENLSSEETV